MHFLAILCLSIIAGSNVANATDNPDGLFLRKTVTTSPDADGNYWLDLEAYVTGSIETVSEYPGLDVVMVLDVSSSLNSSEINTLKKASADFVTKLKDYKGDAKVGLVTFSKGVETITDGLVSAKDNGDDLATKIGALSNTGDGTYVNLGMYYGTRMILNLPKDDKRKRVLLLFTDGEPTSSKTTAGKDRNPYAQACDAINFSSEAKKAGCEVYAIAIGIKEKRYIYTGGTTDTETQELQNGYFVQMDEFLKHVSSMYPSAYVDGTPETASYQSRNIKKNWTSPVVSSPAYYQTVKDGETAKLEQIFAAISEDITHLPSIDLSEKTVLLDGITREFRLPAGFAASDIQTYTAAYAGVDGSGVPQWGTLTTFAASKDYTPNVDGTSTVTVTNFNFQENWCGDNKGANHGKKLVVRFPIIPKETTVGGVDIPTNTEDSGIYLDGEAVGHFPIPDVDLPKRLVIRKVGLNAGESAIFKVSRISEGSAPVELYTIMLTGAKDKEYIEKTICNLDPHFEYSVTETDWSWSYTPEGATSMTTTPTSTNPLTFTNIKNTNTVKNAEAMVENTFDSIRTDASHSRLCNTTSDTAW